MTVWEGSDRALSFEPLTAEDRAQGFVTLNLIVQWDNWVKRRVEQVRFVSTSSVSRRHSVDFRLREDLFGLPHMTWGKKKVHYVPLVLLHKQALSHFDLKDEDGMTLPMVSRHKNARIGAATLAAWAQTLIHQRLVQQIEHARRDAGCEGWRLPTIVGAHTGEHPLRPQSIRLPEETEELFWRLCYRSYQDPTDPDRGSAKALLRKVLVAPYQSDRVLNWRWQRQTLPEGTVWTSPAGDPWLPVLNRFDLFRQLASDFARLFVMYVPIEHEPDRRRIIKFSYEAHFHGPGINAMRGLRAKARGFARRIRQFEDWSEGFRGSRDTARREWLTPRPPVEGGLRPLTLLETLGRAFGWVPRGAVFDVLSVGLGGTFHLEFSAPEGTQVKRATLTAKRPEERRGARRARRYAANVERCHLYLGEPRQGTSGTAFVSLKPQSSTIIRGAFLAALGTLGLLVFVCVFQGNAPDERSASDSGRNIIALLLLAPALLATYTARASEHRMTISMVFGLRFLAGIVAICAGVAAALLVAGEPPDAMPIVWGMLLLVAFGICAILGFAWRLAARAWPHRDEI